MVDSSLEQFVEEVAGTSHLRIEHDFGGGFVRLRTSEAERRQAAQDIRCTENIVLELLRNARDAHAAHVFIAYSKEGASRVLTVIDDGDGIPASMHELVFEPRVTSKLDTSHMDDWGLHGRGMALFSIAANAKEARVCSSDVGLGCSVRVETDLAKLPEKTDQSSFPTFALREGSSSVAVRGPRNIQRTACEFAIATRSNCSVFLGSPAETAAAIYAYGTSTLSAIDRAFCADASQLPLVKRLATAADPQALAEMALDMGLELSERTARRIMNGEVSFAPPLLERIVIEREGEAKVPGGKRRKPRAAHPARLSPADTSALKEALSGAYQPIAERYYLEGDVEVRVTCLPDRIALSIPLVSRH